jgi:hypothetical protein
MISVSALSLGGFVLAHAAWILSEIEAGELLCPFAMLEKGDGRELLPFEADTQEEAIFGAKAHLMKLGSEIDAWAFAREGLIRDAGEAVDVISVDLFARGMDEPVALVQRYQSLAPHGQFKLLGIPDVVINGTREDAATASTLLSSVREGAHEHEFASTLWNGWKGW